MIDGLTYVPRFVEDEAALVATIDAHPWMTDLKRRVQHYGYRYDYKRRAVTPEMYLGKLPEWLLPLAVRLHTHGYMPDVPDQCIINEYHPGQGISAHVDCEPCFGDVICSLSLRSPCVMTFRRNGKQFDYKLDPGSLIVLSGEARYHWTHAIPARKTDRLNGDTWKRARRVSVTFRNVVLE